MLERNPRHREIQAGFRSLCEKILAREGAIVVETGWKAKNGKAPPTQADFVFKRPPDTELTVVEAKYLRSRRMEDGLFRHALDDIRRFRDTRKAGHAILIITAEPTDMQMQEAERQAVQLWGIAQLLPMAQKTPTLAETFADLLRELAVHPGQFLREMQQLEGFTARSKSRGDGARLIGEFEQTRPGKENQRKFEQVGEKALRLLFADQVQRWSLPVASDDGQHRPSMVARLLPHHDVWLTLQGDFSSRYMTVSFVNGAEPAGYGEVHAAARHLHPKAQRSIAILVSRAGFDGGARRAAVEELRENGKLVLTVTLPDLREMLTARDGGDDYHDFFHERASELMADNTL